MSLRILVPVACCVIVLTSAAWRSPSSPPTTSTLSTDLVFIPDAGIRKATAAMSGVGIDANGTAYLYYVDPVTNQSLVATAADGLNFGAGAPYGQNHANDSRRTLLPDGTWRLYEFAQPAAVIHSDRSTDGVSFQLESGTRYTPVAADHGVIGVFDAFTEGSRVILLYLGDLFGVNNLRRAISTDNGVTFTFDQANVLADAAAGTTNTYVDPQTIRLPDGRRRLLVMKRVAGSPTQGGEIDSFISSNGVDYTLEAGNRLKLADFTSIAINSLNDPDIVRLADGRYRIYVSARVTSTNQFSIVSATTGPVPVFTDDPLVSSSSLIKAVHITELRTTIDTLRTRYGLAAFAWTDPTLSAGTTTVKAVHVAELRTALQAAYAAAGIAAPVFTDPALTTGSSAIRATHLTELRAAVLALW